MILRARTRGIFLRGSQSKVFEVLTACASVSRVDIESASPWGSTTLDSDSLRRIPREKFRTKINIPRARENVRQLGVVILVQHISTAEK